MKIWLRKYLALNRPLRLSLAVVWMLGIFLLSHNSNSNDQTKAVFGDLNFVVRKAAHAFEFYLLYILLRLSNNEKSADSLNNWQADLVALVLTILYAGSDEWHQSFVKGRSASLIDVGIDSSGAIVGLLMVRYLLRTKFRA